MARSFFFLACMFLYVVVFSSFFKDDLMAAIQDFPRLAHDAIVLAMAFPSLAFGYLAMAAYAKHKKLRN
jgi:hypothetical protein